MKKAKRATGRKPQASGKTQGAWNLQPAAWSKTADLLLEIGTEELPAAYLDGAIRQLRQEAAQRFRNANLAFAHAEAFGTPRRLVLVVWALSGTQRNPTEEIRGPSKHASFDNNGKPTDALKGFLRARGGGLSQIKVVSTEKGDYVYLRKPERHVPTATVLPQLLGQVIRDLRFPKTMRWDDGDVRFARPVRWVLARYGTTAVRVSMGRLTSGRTTWLGGPKRPNATPVHSASQYFAVLKRQGIVLDQRQRRARIEHLVRQFAKQHRGQPVPEIVTHGLLDEVTHLVEQPVALLGQFDPRYLVLPREVLLASMAKYQRVFAMETSGGLPAPSAARQAGTLLPKFVAILDGSPRKMSRVRQMYEHILNARLADSLLFWQQDHKTLPLDRLTEQLKEVSFHERLGSMADKTLRLRGLGEPLADAWQLTDGERQHLRRACQLAKHDLVSTMVKEFPTLQGVVGKYYARDSGEPPAVADALEEQYLPVGERLPKTLIGSALALLDKYDTLTSYFGLGIEPTGDEDPFGLRRAAQGIVEVAWRVHRPLPLGALLRARSSMEPFRTAQPKEIARVGNRIQRYLFDRLYTFSWPPPTPTNDLIGAVLSSNCDDLVDVMDRILHLQQLDGKRTLLKAAKVVERTRNILKTAAVRQTEVDPSRLQEPLEHKLWELYSAHKDRLRALIQGKAYADATAAYGEVFFEALHEFFERVMVNVKEEALQQNRLALMQAINTLYTERVADLSKLAILQPRINPAELSHQR